MKIYRTSQQEQVERTSREAAEWLHVMKSTPASAERAAFANWLASSPLHVREVLLADMLERELSGSGVLDGYDVDAIVAQARAENNVVSLPVRAPGANTAVAQRRERRRGMVWGRAAAVALVFLLGVVGWLGMQPYLGAGAEYATAIGEKRAVELDDGTMVALAPDSRIRVEFSDGERRVTLRRGQAEFDVKHDEARPFRVYAGVNMIQDIGTRFSVNRLPSGTIVAVTEGSVEVSTDHMAALDSGLGAWVSSWLPSAPVAIERPGVKVEPMDQVVHLTAGQAAHIARNGKALTRGSVKEDRQAPANADRLIFHDDTLADIVAEFNRYNPTRIVIDGDALRLQRYSGVFDATDANSFLQFLDCCSQLAVIRHEDRWVIEARAGEAVRKR